MTPARAGVRRHSRRSSCALSRTLHLCTLVLLTGCAASYGLVPPGTVRVDGLEVDVSEPWNRAPSGAMPAARSDAAVWTRDGLLLNRLMIVPAVPAGEAILRDRGGRAALPRFAADMLPNELEEFLQSSLTKLYGEGASSVATSNLRPHRFGERPGILLDLSIALSEGPEYRGLAGAFVANELLYVLVYAAATPHYYDALLPEASAIIEGARLGGRPE